MYSTRFDGRFEVSPPLGADEIEFLTAFAGPASGPHNAGRDGMPSRGRPLSWCQWVPAPDGTALVWDGDEQFFRYTEWLVYLVETFLSPRARLRRALRGCRDRYPKALSGFTFDHVVDGIVTVRDSAGHEERIVVRNNRIEIVPRKADVRTSLDTVSSGRGVCTNRLPRPGRGIAPPRAKVL